MAKGCQLTPNTSAALTGSGAETVCHKIAKIFSYLCHDPVFSGFRAGILAGNVGTLKQKITIR
jgi:hypothetical protein